MRIRATDIYDAAERYWRHMIEGAEEEQESCIGDVRVTDVDGARYDVTVSSSMVLDVEAIRKRKSSGTNA